MAEYPITQRDINRGLSHAQHLWHAGRRMSPSNPIEPEQPVRMMKDALEQVDINNHHPDSGLLGRYFGPQLFIMSFAPLTEDTITDLLLSRDPSLDHRRKERHIKGLVDLFGAHTPIQPGPNRTKATVALRQEPTQDNGMIVGNHIISTTNKDMEDPIRSLGLTETADLLDRFMSFTAADIIRAPDDINHLRLKRTFR